MNIAIKILNKIQATKPNNTLKGSYTTIKWDFFQGCKNCSIYANQSTQYTTLTLKSKNVIISIDAERVCDKIQKFICDENSLENEHRGTLSPHSKGHIW